MCPRYFSRTSRHEAAWTELSPQQTKRHRATILVHLTRVIILDRITVSFLFVCSRKNYELVRVFRAGCIRNHKVWTKSFRFDREISTCGDWYGTAEIAFESVTSNNVVVGWTKKWINPVWMVVTVDLTVFSSLSLWRITAYSIRQPRGRRDSWRGIHPSRGLILMLSLFAAGVTVWVVWTLCQSLIHYVAPELWL